MQFINVTPHTINLNDGRVFITTDTVARVSASYSDFDADGICCQQFGEVQDLPAPVDGVRYIVSAMVLSAVKVAGRTDCVAPATGHPDCVRNDMGHIMSVPGFVS